MTRTVEAQLRISAVDRTGQVFKSVAGKMGEINRRAEALNRQQSALARGTQAAYGAMLRYAAPAALAYGAKRALTDFAAVERQMNRIGITANASVEETNAAFTRLQDISKQTSLPVDQAITALDTLVASGLDLKEAMDFLPSVLNTAQASGSATEDIANTAIKAASALKLETGQMQHAFDIMVAGGKAGQFELKDMATYIPDLANSFASLGYTGEDGLKKLVSILQTIREDTGSASSAATYAQNIFGKIYSQDTATKFSKMGVDLRKELDAARKSGEDTVSAFVRISKEAIKGDLSKLPLLFTDEQFRLGMQSLMTSADSYEKFLKTVNSSEVDGTVFRDLARVTGDTQSSIDKLSSSWDKLMNSIGRGVSRPAVPLMDAISRDIDYGDAVRSSLQKQGKGYWATESWMALNLPFGSFSKSADADKMALDGGYRDPDFIHRMRQGPNMPQGPRLPEFPGGDRKLDPHSLPSTGVPMPGARPGVSPSIANVYGEFARSHQPAGPARTGATMAGMPSPIGPGVTSWMKDFFRIPSKEEFREALKIDATGLKESGDEAGQKVADGGREAGASIKESAATLTEAGNSISSAILSAAKELATAASSFNRATAIRPPVNANTGRSMPAQAGAPAGGGGGGGF
ncbi:TP901 family phage tail tape measure protein [Rhizobium sp. BK181]|uniref:phage tail tape measure protein n=1 Tax=Rhizobium sp. BK181 TaxID=2587072 RepID=UPI0016183F52|nr:phage tail tape measure protein [Rhizobium sp. BK181]MBB3315115.1 TP901 family phage tail tape measure protein [Rhizobium sp. BK181]